MADTINCPSCGFPNPAGSHSCISCQSPLDSGQRRAEASGPGVRLRPVSTPAAGRPASPPTPVQLDENLDSPDAILERIRQVRGEDALKSLEMMAIPDLDRAVKADLAAGASQAPAPQTVVTSWPQAPVPQAVAQSSPHFAPAPPKPPEGRVEDPWFIDHHEARAVEARDPWTAGFSSSTAGATKTSTAAKSGWGFKPIDLVSAAGIVAILVSVALPWISVHGGEEGRELGPASLPLTLLIKGPSETYPLPWLTATVVMIALVIVATLGLAFPRNQLAVTGLTVAGMMTILIPAAFLVKLAVFGEAATEDESVYVAATGMYIAIGASLTLLLGAALRGSKAR